MFYPDICHKLFYTCFIFPFANQQYIARFRNNTIIDSLYNRQASFIFQRNNIPFTFIKFRLCPQHRIKMLIFRGNIIQ